MAGILGSETVPPTMSRVFHRRDCRLCGGQELVLVLPLVPTPVADDYVSFEHLSEPQETYPLDLFLCRGCGHVQLLDVVEPEALFRNYIYVSSSSPGLVEHFRRYADEVCSRLKPPNGTLVLDIGSNDGTLLKFFQGRGMRVLGVDPARDIASKATDSGIETLPTFFTAELAREVRRSHGPAAIITANNVFAHADHLADMADGTRDLMAPDGVFVFEVSYLVDLMREMVFDSVYHEHLCYHSVKPLQDFFHRHGMELIDTERVSTKGGSLRGTVQCAGGPRTVSPAVSELIAVEENLGLDRPEAFSAFAAKIDNAKTQFAGVIQDLQARGKTIAGYGASATTTTLMYHFDLGRAITFIVDDNPQRQGLFSPGHHIPILPPQAIYERRPDYVIILAWRFSRPIIKKHQAYLDQGGRFIVPLPKIELFGGGER